MLKLQVPNMTCGGCESKLRKALASVKGIRDLQVDRGNKLIQVKGDMPESGIIKAIEDAGFAVIKEQV